MWILIRTALLTMLSFKELFAGEMLASFRTKNASLPRLSNLDVIPVGGNWRMRRGVWRTSPANEPGDGIPRVLGCRGYAAWAYPVFKAFAVPRIAARSEADISALHRSGDPGTAVSED